MKWRLLEIGEEIKEGDEMFVNLYWILVWDELIGQNISPGHALARRKIVQPKVSLEELADLIHVLLTDDEIKSGCKGIAKIISTKLGYQLEEKPEWENEWHKQAPCFIHQIVKGNDLTAWQMAFEAGRACERNKK
jgi:hypothetical protein